MSSSYVDNLVEEIDKTNRKILEKIADIAHLLRRLKQNQNFQKCTRHVGWTYRCIKGGENCVTCLVCEVEATIDKTGNVCGKSMCIEAPYEEIPELEHNKKVLFLLLLNDLARLIKTRDANLKWLLYVLANGWFTDEKEDETDDPPLEEMTALDMQVGGDHYKVFKIQPVEFIHHNNLPFCLGNVVKYVCRYVVKKDPVDLDKAIHYLELQKLLDARGESDG